MSSRIDPVECFIRSRFGPDELAEALSRHWKRYRDAGLATDRNLEREICSGSEAKFNQRYWEIAIGNLLLDHGLAPRTCAGREGPDFRIEQGERTIWIEAIAPERGHGPDAPPDWRTWLPQPRGTGVATGLPDIQRFLLRVTHALREKRNKFVEYMEKGIIGELDSCVIAINVCNLGPTGLRDVTDFGMLLRALLPIGDYACTFNRATMDIIATWRHPEHDLSKATGPVPKMLLSPEFQCVSAVIGADFGPTIRATGRKHMAAVHNPRAQCSIPLSVLPVEVEFEIVEHDGGGDIVTHTGHPDDDYRVLLGYRSTDENAR